jgi:predicted RNase H-like HicB family nuclease
MAKQKQVSVSLPVMITREGELYIAYTPALDISTQGKSLEQVKERFDELVKIFFKDLHKRNKVDEVLEECGWQKVKKPHICWQVPTTIETLSERVKVPCPA